MFPEKEKIELILKKLQEIMRLQDWDIKIKCMSTISLSEQYGKDAKYVRGDCNRDINHSEATIRLNKEYDIDPEENWFYKTLIHELHHVITSRYEIYVANAVNQITNEQLLSHIGSTMGIEYENITDNFAKLFVSVYPLERCLKDIGISI